MEYDVLAFIGRFQPFHLGHKAVVDQALTKAKKVAIVIGSHDQPRDTRNPFTTAERIAMITSVFPEEVAAKRIHFVPQINHAYNDDRWIAGVQTGVGAVANTPFTPDPVKIGLIGHAKDRSSYYLKCFPTWGSVEVENFAGIDATEIRHAYFSNDDRIVQGAKLPASVDSWLEDFWENPAVDILRDEFRFNNFYRRTSRMPTEVELSAMVGSYLPEEFQASGKALIQEFARQFKSPYAPTFHTVDAIVTQSGHILLVERGALPGKGLWALPGGFLEQTETLKEGMLRELREETRIDLSDETLLRCIRSQRTFDAPNRSARGRTITTAFHIELRPDVKLTKVKGGDDAAKARWVPLSQVARSAMFEDHFDLILSMVGL